MSQFHTSGSGEELHVDGWDGGVCIFSMWTDGVDELVRVLVAWLDDRVSPSEVGRRFPGAAISDHAALHFQGVDAEVETAWEDLRAGTIFSAMRTLVAAAYARPELRALFPFTRLGEELCFSRCTGYPYTTVDPSIVAPVENPSILPPTPKGQEPLFVVFSGGRYGDDLGGGELVFRGWDVDEAVDAAVAVLPDAGPTRQGTAEDTTD